jgi:5,10-methylenetetrahydromethanopterin reductase
MIISVTDLPGRAKGITLKQTIELARIADGAIDRFGIIDAPFFPDCATTIAAVLTATSSLAVESAITTPYRRAPDTAAQVWGTLAELSDGRAILGIGRGSNDQETWVEPWGFERRGANDAIAQLVKVCRQMWAGQTPDAPGPWKLTGRPLEFTVNHPVPILIAGRGPKILTLAAQTADIVQPAVPFTGVGYINDNVALIRAAAEAVGRSPEDYEIDITVALSISADGDHARHRAKRHAANGLAALAAAVRPTGVGPVVVSSGTEHEFVVPENIANAIIGSAYAPAPPTSGPGDGTGTWARVPLPPALEELIDDRLLDAFVVAGTPQQVLDRMHDLRKQIPAATGWRFKPAHVSGDGYAQYREQIELVSELASSF